MSDEVIAHPEYATVERTIRRMQKQLLQRYGAHHIGVSKKRRGGRKQSQTCITFYVLKKGEYEAGQGVPASIELDYGNGARRGRIATDVCEIGGEPEGFLLRGGNVIVSDDNENGTVGLVFRRDGRDFLLTNAHVITDPGAKPGPVTVTSTQGVEVEGIVTRLDDLEADEIKSDAALISVPPDSVEPGTFQQQSLRLESCGEILNNDKRKFFYVSDNEERAAEWLAAVPGKTEVKIDGRKLPYARFHKLKMVKGQCGPGDSGAVVFCKSSTGLTAVGLLFGGIVAANEILVFPVRHCLDRMGVDPDSI